MATTYVDWPEGGGRLTVTTGSGQSVFISSDANTGVDRETVLTFRAGTASAQLDVSQPGLRAPVRTADSGLPLVRLQGGAVLTVLKNG